MQRDTVRTQTSTSIHRSSTNRFVFALNAIFKRLVDIVVSFLALILLSPVFIGIAIAIKRESSGPVLFKGKRMGINEKPFYILKFRTMCEPSDLGINGPAVTASDDPRVTKLGRYLRDTKLNELPQLWNVLIGEMSFVGPRPEDYEIALGWDPQVRKEILSMRPGITSPASIIYRNEETLLQGDGFMDDYLSKILPDKQRLDLLYVRNHNFFTDIDVLAATFLTLLPGLRNRKIDERYLFGGPILVLFRKIVPWFLIDVVVVTFAVGLSGVVWRLSTVIDLGVPTFIVLALAIAVVISLINSLLGLQKISWYNASASYIFDLLISVTITMVLLWVFNRFVITVPRIPFSMFWLIGLTTFIFLVTVRYRDRIISSLSYRWLLLRGTSASFAERILIVGAGELGELTAWLIQRSHYSPLFGVVGFVDDDPHKRNLRPGGITVLGSSEAIPELVEKYSIAVIMLALSDGDEAEKSRIKALCKSTGAIVVVMPDMIKNLENALENTGINGNGK